MIHPVDLHSLSTGTSKRQKVTGNPKSLANYQAVLQSSRGENFEGGRSSSHTFVSHNSIVGGSSSSVNGLASAVTSKASQSRTRGAESINCINLSCSEFFKNQNSVTGKPCGKICYFLSMLTISAVALTLMSLTEQDNCARSRQFFEAGKQSQGNATTSTAMARSNGQEEVLVPPPPSPPLE
jgi:hypothetical protein